MDDLIAEHALSQGHWPGLTVAEIKAKIDEVRSGFQDAYDFGNGRRIFRKGAIILIEDGTGSGTIFRPSPRSAADYFVRYVDCELGGV